MKTRLLSLLISFAMLSVLVACGGNGGEQAVSPESDFDAGTQDYSQNGVSFKVPGSWSKTDSGNGFVYFYPENSKKTSFLMVSYTESSESDPSILSPVAFDSFVNGMVEEMENSKVIESGTRETTAGVKYGFAKVSGTISNIEVTIDSSVVDCFGGFISLGMCVDAEDSNDYSTDYNKILNSVVVVKEPAIYPVGADTIIEDIDKIAAPPATVYTTPASENGLKDTMYKIVGVVEKYVPSEEAVGGIDYVLVRTDGGTIAVTNPSTTLRDEFSKSGYSFDEGKFNNFFKMPSSGDFVCMYAQYQGFSDKLNCATAVYGGGHYAGYAAGKALTTSTTPPASNDSAPVSKPQEQGTQTNKPNITTTTTGQKNALKAAKNYLSFMPFSYSGLIKQLEYEEYSHDDAVYAADNCGADWNEQAAKSAENYLSTMSFSRNSLIKQLEYEGFTNEQAVYGAEANGY